METSALPEFRVQPSTVTVGTSRDGMKLLRKGPSKRGRNNLQSQKSPYVTNKQFNRKKDSMAITSVIFQTAKPHVQSCLYVVSRPPSLLWTDEPLSNVEGLCAGYRQFQQSLAQLTQNHSSLTVLSVVLLYRLKTVSWEGNRLCLLAGEFGGKYTDVHLNKNLLMLIWIKIM
jgi:hypothetical protein